ncbi:carboxyl-terminal protease-like protein [Marinobacter sp. M-5]|uniref:carboxyl-terminal protease-like protein n=1 Tax=Marinobacter sp. M-5 TaxID=3081089 RepID=UPI00293C1E50|nr:carboxyl-terminal protease-like protein [Marinobacter sp. M-5]MDV3504703.1 carboxyl-terminal protease-like protein [Marinobacter sp. M-5]
MEKSSARQWKAVFTATLATLALSGCAVYKLDDSALDKNAQAYQQTTPFTTDSPILEPWLIPAADDLPAVEVVQSQSANYITTSGLNFLASLLTLTLVPAVDGHEYTDTLQVVWDGETLATSSASYSIKQYFSVYFPTPMLFLGSLYETDQADLTDTLETISVIHARNIADTIAGQQPRFDRIAKDDPDALAAFVKTGDAPLFNPLAVAGIAALAPVDNRLEYHRTYAELPGYINVLPLEAQAWLIGPDGLKGWQIKEALDNGEEEAELLRKVVSSYPADLTQWNQETRRVETRYRTVFADTNPQLVTNLLETYAEKRAQWPYYPNMTDEHRRTLVENGVPASIVSYMSNTERSAELIAAAKTGPLQDAQGQMLTEEQLLERLVRKDNAGPYLSPYTSDDVFAEWVNLANNASMGASVGTAAGAMAGAYAAEKALDFVPFGLGGLIGGAVGAEIGKETGRETAISASGGWEAIKASSDRSFDSLTDMARYLKRKYGTTANFNDAVKATSQIYPEFGAVLASTY